MEGYEILNKLGEGSYGQAHLALKSETNSKCVLKEIKVCHLNEKDLSDAKKEVQVLSSLVHEYITRFHDSFEANGSLFIVMEYCAGGDLQSLIDNRNGIYFPEARILDWFVQLGLAIRFIHQRHIIHRDIKTQNVFLTQEGRIKLGDFGIAKILDKTSDLANTCIGTPYYLSPEMCETKPYSNKSDIWAVGCVLYEMCCLKHAYDASNIKSLVLKIIKCSYEALPPRYSRDLKFLIHQIFQREPKFRPSMTSILLKPFLARSLSRYVSEEEAKELNLAAKTRTRLKPQRSYTNTKGADMRSRIGISSPASKYLVNNSYKQTPSVCVPSKRPRVNSKLRDYPNKSTFKFSPNSNKGKCSNSHHEMHQIKKGKRLSLNVNMVKGKNPPKLKSDEVRPRLNCSQNSCFIQKNRNHPSSNQNTSKISLKTRENTSTPQNRNIPKSFYKHLSKLQDSETSNCSGWLGDLYLSKKLLAFNQVQKRNTRSPVSFVDKVLMDINQGKYVGLPQSSNKYSQEDGIEAKVSSVIAGEMQQATQNACIQREAAYVKERNLIHLNEKKGVNFKDESTGSSLLVVYGRDMICINDGTFNSTPFQSKRNQTFKKSKLTCFEDFYPPPSRLTSILKLQHSKPRQDFHNFTPIGKRQVWQQASTPLFDINHPLEFSGSKMDATSPNDMVTIFNSRKHWDCQPRSSIVNILSSAELMDGSLSNRLEGENLLNSCNETINSKNVSCTESDAQEKVENPSELPVLTDNESSILLDTQNIDVSEMEVNSSTIKITDEINNKRNIVSSEYCPTHSSESDMKGTLVGKGHSKGGEDRLESSRSSKKGKRKFLSFLQRSQSDASCHSSPKSNSASGTKNKSRFSGLLKKILHRSDSSKSKICKSLENDFVEVNHVEVKDVNAAPLKGSGGSENVASTERSLGEEHFVSDYYILKGKLNCTNKNSILEETSDSGVESCQTSEQDTCSTLQTVLKQTNCQSTHDLSQTVINNSSNDMMYTSKIEIPVNKDLHLINNDLSFKREMSATNFSDTNHSSESDEKTLTNETVSELQLPEVLNTQKNDLQRTAAAIVKIALDEAKKQLESKRSNASDSKNFTETSHNYFNFDSKSPKILNGKFDHRSNISVPSENESDETLSKIPITKTKRFSSSVIVSPGLLEKIKNKIDPVEIPQKCENNETLLLSSSQTKSKRSNAKSSVNGLENTVVLALSPSPESGSSREDLFNNINGDKTWSKSKGSPMLFRKRNAAGEEHASSKSSMSEGEVEDVANFRRSLEDLLETSNLEVFHAKYSSQEDLNELMSELPETPEGDIHQWIEERRAALEQRLGLETFMEAYRCLECAFEQNNSDLGEALGHVKKVLGPRHEGTADAILKLIVTESIHFY